jgi:hypothetical protein
MAITYASNVFTVTVNTSTAGTGTITSAPTTVKLGAGTFGAAAIAGVGTAFTTQLRPGSIIIVSGVSLIIHSVQSNVSCIAFRKSSTDSTYTLATPTGFNFQAPTLLSDMLTAVAGQAATIAQGNVTSINFVTSSITINSNAVLIMDTYADLTFGSSAGYRINNNDGFLVFRNGGSIVYNGNVQHSFFNGYLNVWSGTLSYVGNSPGTTNTRVDFFSGSTSSNGISSLIVMYAGGGATNCKWYTHLENIANKFGELKFVNATTISSIAGLNNGINLQFGNGTYNNVTFPSTTSTLGNSQLLSIYLARSGGTSILIDPVIPGSQLSLIGDAAGAAQLIDESWPDLPAGSVGTLVRDAIYPGNTTVSRRFTFYPGTLYVPANPVYLRIANNVGTTAVNGAITSAAGIQLSWQTYATSSNVTTNFYPFSLLARRKDLLQVLTPSFTPTAPITYNSPLLTDPTYTADASTETGIAVSTVASTLTLSSAVTNDRIYDYGKYWLEQNLATPNYLSPNGAILTFVPTWTVVNVNRATAGTKIDTLASATAFTATGVIATNKITGNVIENTPTNITNTTITGNLTFNTNTPVTVVFTGSTITGTVSNSGTGLVTITLASGSTIGTVGSNVVTQRFANVTAPNIIVGSRVQLYDTTNNVELFNGVLASALNYQHTFVGNITVRLRATYQSGLTAKLPVEATGLLTATGLSFLNSQTDDGVYIGNLINGSTVTEYTPDYPNLQVDVAGGSSTTVQRLYNWSTYNETTADGIRYLFSAISAIDAVNYLIDQAILDVKLDNTGATPVVISGGVITRKDGTTVIAATSGSIQIDPAKAYVANSAEISIDLQTIKNYTAASV